MSKKKSKQMKKDKYSPLEKLALVHLVVDLLKSTIELIKLLIE